MDTPTHGLASREVGLPRKVLAFVCSLAMVVAFTPTAFFVASGNAAKAWGAEADPGQKLVVSYANSASATDSDWTAVDADTQTITMGAGATINVAAVPTPTDTSDSSTIAGTVTGATITKNDTVSFGDTYSENATSAASDAKYAKGSDNSVRLTASTETGVTTVRFSVSTGTGTTAITYNLKVNVVAAPAVPTDVNTGTAYNGEKQFLAALPSNGEYTFKTVAATDKGTLDTDYGIVANDDAEGADNSNAGRPYATYAGEYTVTATLATGFKWAKSSASETDLTSDRTFEATIDQATASFAVAGITNSTVRVHQKVDVTVNATAGTNTQTGVELTSTDYPNTSAFTAQLDSAGKKKITVEGIETSASATTVTVSVAADAKRYKAGTVTFDVNVVNIQAVEKPVAVTGLTYNGEAQTLVAGNEAYTLKIGDGEATAAGTNAAATNAGTYSVTATLVSGFKWADETTDAFTLSATIGKKEGVGVSTLADPAAVNWADKDKGVSIDVAAATGVSGAAYTATLGSGSGSVVEIKDAAADNKYTIDKLMLTVKNPGTATLTITLQEPDGNANYQLSYLEADHKKTVTITVNPAGTVAASDFSLGSLVYTGKAQVAAEVAADAGVALSVGTADKTVPETDGTTYKYNGITVASATDESAPQQATVTNAGNYYVIATLTDGYVWADDISDDSAILLDESSASTAYILISVAKAAASITGAPSSLAVKVGDTTEAVQLGIESAATLPENAAVTASSTPTTALGSTDNRTGENVIKPTVTNDKLTVTGLSVADGVDVGVKLTASESLGANFTVADVDVPVTVQKADIVLSSDDIAVDGTTEKTLPAGASSAVRVSATTDTGDRAKIALNANAASDSTVNGGTLTGGNPGSTTVTVSPAGGDVDATVAFDGDSVATVTAKVGSTVTTPQTYTVTVNVAGNRDYAAASTSFKVTTTATNTVALPEVPTNLTYTGSAIELLTATDAYKVEAGQSATDVAAATISGNTATGMNAGKYAVKVTPNTGFVWAEDATSGTTSVAGTNNSVELVYTIAKASVRIDGLSAADKQQNLTYDPTASTRLTGIKLVSDSGADVSGLQLKFKVTAAKQTDGNATKDTIKANDKTASGTNSPLAMKSDILRLQTAAADPNGYTSGSVILSIDNAEGNDVKANFTDVDATETIIVSVARADITVTGIDTTAQDVRLGETKTYTATINPAALAVTTNNVAATVTKPATNQDITVSAVTTGTTAGTVTFNVTGNNISADANEVTFSVANDNYNTQSVVMPFNVVAKTQITLPTGSFAYTGQSITLAEATDSYTVATGTADNNPEGKSVSKATVSSNAATATNAGLYSVTVTPNAGYEWASGVVDASTGDTPNTNTSALQAIFEIKGAAAYIGGFSDADTTQALTMGTSKVVSGIKLFDGEGAEISDASWSVTAAKADGTKIVSASIVAATGNGSGQDLTLTPFDVASDPTAVAKVTVSATATNYAVEDAVFDVTVAKGAVTLAVKDGSADIADGDSFEWEWGTEKNLTVAATLPDRTTVPYTLTPADTKLVSAEGSTLTVVGVSDSGASTAVTVKAQPVDESDAGKYEPAELTFNVTPKKADFLITATPADTNIILPYETSQNAKGTTEITLGIVNSVGGSNTAAEIKSVESADPAKVTATLDTNRTKLTLTSVAITSEPVTVTVKAGLTEASAKNAAYFMATEKTYSANVTVASTDIVANSEDAEVLENLETAIGDLTIPDNADALTVDITDALAAANELSASYAAASDSVKAKLAVDTTSITVGGASITISYKALMDQKVSAVVAAKDAQAATISTWETSVEADYAKSDWAKFAAVVSSNGYLAVYKGYAAYAKSLISDEVKSELEAAETAIASDTEAAHAFVTEVNALPTTITIDDVDAVTKARADYEALSAYAKTLENIETATTGALAKLATAEDALGQAVTGVLVGEEVAAALATTPQTADSIKVLENALATWNALSPDAKSLADGSAWAVATQIGSAIKDYYDTSEQTESMIENTTAENVDDLLAVWETWEGMSDDEKKAVDGYQAELAYRAKAAADTFLAEHNLGDADRFAVEFDADSKTYNGTAQKPAVTVSKLTYTGDSGDATKAALTEGTDYTVDYGTGNYTDAGTYKVTVNPAGQYNGSRTVSFVVNPASQAIAAKGVTVKAKKAKKKAVKAAASFTASGGGKVTWAKASSKGKVSIAKNGKITVKKGTKKGTYKLKVKVTAAANGNYAATTATVTLVVKVK